MRRDVRGTFGCTLNLRQTVRRQKEEYELRVAGTYLAFRRAL